MDAHVYAVVVCLAAGLPSRVLDEYEGKPARFLERYYNNNEPVGKAVNDFTGYLDTLKSGGK